ncbi:acetyl-CoA carboxylase biotin carboxyl carrier protein [bacterium]|nr:acetyl-CoA carboxylase biotin carboxyl carrier protein [bacterium]
MVSSSQRKAVEGVAVKKERGETSPLNLRSLKKIVTIMNRAKITELDIEQDGVRIHLRKGEGVNQVMATPMMQSMPAPQPVMVPAAPAPAPPASAAPAVEDDANYYTIKSPMVGTFYRSPSPESKAFIEVGAEVSENSVVCIVEAMKLMNEIKAEVKGKIKKILVENAQAVEFGQPLFQVERKG